MSSEKNLHMTHLEDQVFIGGVNGIRSSINFLQSLRDMLAGTGKSKPVKVTTKFDGSPAIICGINPENGKFFVSTKSAFNKTPKLNYTPADIDSNHPGELASILKIALANLSKLGITGILQGDFMFSKSTIQQKTIDGKAYLVFQPNTIAYAVPVESAMAEEIRKAQMGIIFHTVYKGDTIAGLKASFNIDISRLNKTPDVWVRDAEYSDITGSAKMNDETTKFVTSLLSSAGTIFQKLSSREVESIATNETLVMYINTWNNSLIRNNKKIENSNTHFNGLIDFLKARYQKAIDELKTPEKKNQKMKERDFIINDITKKKLTIVKMFEIMVLLAEAKTVIVRQLEKIDSINTFVNTPTGYKVTNAEGFVAISEDGKTVKLVDRLTFSYMNFERRKT